MSAFADKALQILIDQVPENHRAHFHVHADGYFCGPLGINTTSFSILMPGHRHDLELFTTHREAFSALIHALPGSALMSFAKPAVDAGGWTWCDKAFEGLPGSIRMADPLFSLHFTEVDGQMKVEAWQDIEGAERLTAFPVGEDPRIAIPGLDWLRYIRGKTKPSLLEQGASCEFKPTGFSFETHTESMAEFIERSYGPLFDLPSCEVTKSVSGSRMDRLYRIDIEIPGARPMMGVAAVSKRILQSARNRNRK